MNEKFKVLISKLREFNWDLQQYAIFGSGPLVIRALRETHDLDIIVSKQLWDILANKYQVIDNKLIQIDGIEIYRNWKPWFSDIEQLINSAEVIDRLPFVKLKYVLEWKKSFNREKDMADIKIIENYLKKQLNARPENNQ